MTTIETLGQQHQTVLARLQAVEAAMPGPAAVLEDFHAFLAGELGEHFELEEAALFPILATRPQLAAGPIAVMEAEHLEFRSLLAELGAALGRPGGEHQAAVTSRLIVALLRAHIEKEDHVLFPLAAEVLTADELATLEARAAALARRAPCAAEVAAGRR